MNTRKLLVSILMLVSVLLSACAPAVTATPAPTSVPPTSAPPSAPAPRPTALPTATLDHGDIPPELVGTWSFTSFGRLWLVHLTAEGTFSLYRAGGQLDVSGSYGISGDEVVFRDEIRGIGALCIPAEGRYHWQLTGDRLQFTVIEDKCTVGRIAQWTAGWTRK